MGVVLSIHKLAAKTVFCSDSVLSREVKRARLVRTFIYCLIKLYNYSYSYSLAVWLHG